MEQLTTGHKANALLKSAVSKNSKVVTRDTNRANKTLVQEKWKSLNHVSKNVSNKMAVTKERRKGKSDMEEQNGGDVMSSPVPRPTSARPVRRPLEQFHSIGGNWEASIRSYLANQKLMTKDSAGAGQRRRAGKLFQNSDSTDFPSTHVPVLLPPPLKGTNKLTKFGKPQDPNRLPVGVMEKLVPFYSRPPTARGDPGSSGDSQIKSNAPVN